MATIQTEIGQLFGGYTLEELREQVLKRLRVSDTTRYSPTAGTADYAWIDKALSRAQEDLVKELHSIRTYAIIELKAGYRTYRLPADFIDLMSAYYYDNTLSDGYKELEICTIEELNDEVSDWRTDAGTPEKIYLDRLAGNNYMVGLYPIPDTDGDSITFDSQYGEVVQWVCPMYTFSSEYGTVLRMSDTDEYFLNKDAGVVGQAEIPDKNLWIEYYRLPMEFVSPIQKAELPREYHNTLIDKAVADLLKSNPENTAEFVRARVLEKDVQEQKDIYIAKKKKPQSGKNLRLKPNSWGWVKGMPWYKNVP